MTALGFAANLDGYANTYDDLQRYVERRTRAALARGRSALDTLATPEEVQRHADRIRTAVRVGLGGLPDGAGTPPTVEWGDTTDAGAHTVQRLIFSSMPDVLVTANLYRPAGQAHAARPAVLFVCGHTEAAKADPSYQSVCTRLARAGFVVMAIDPFGQGERLGYLRSDGTAAIAGGTTEHTYAGLPAWWLGASTARWFVHEARRAVDLLADLPEVDPARIGVTGNSGGGTLATLLMVSEPRLAAAAIGTYLTSRGAYLGTGQRQDAEQILLGGTAAGVDHADLLAAMAPRPVAVLAADYDFFPIEGTLDTVERAGRAYGLLGAPTALRLTRAATTHAYAPELATAAVSFFTDVLGPAGAEPTARNAPVLEPAKLQCTRTGQVALDRPEARFLPDLVRADAAMARSPARADAVDWLHERILADREPPTATTVRWLPGPAGTRHAFWRTERDLWSAGVLLAADTTPTDGPRPLHLLLLEHGTDDLTTDHPLLQRSDERELVLALDVRGVGALAPYDRGGLAATDQSSTTYKLLSDLVWLGDSLAAGRAYDVLRAIEMLRTDPHLARDFPGVGLGSPVHLHGEGTGAFAAILAGAVDPTITTIQVHDEVVDPDRMLYERCYDEGRGSWQWVLPGLARHAPLPVLRDTLGGRLTRDTAPPARAARLKWHLPGPPEAKGWARTERPYDRLPPHAEGRVPDPVWQHSRSASGMFVRFRTDSTRVWVRWTVRNPELGMWHMSPAAVSGIDLYARDDTGALRWLGVSRPVAGPANEGPMVEGLDGKPRDYVAYLPLFNPLARVEFGVDAGAGFVPLDPDRRAPIVYYGTSIVHGAVASRPGMSLPAQLGRRLDRTVIGLGFSGVGRMERSLAELLGELDAAAYLIDCLPNMDADLVAARAREFLTTLRTARPETPVLLIEDRSYTDGWAVPARRRHNTESRRALRRAYVELADPEIRYLEGSALLGDDGEATVDASHPTDLGFVRMVDVLAPAVRELLDPD